MTKVQAIIREDRFDAVVERLLLIGVRGLTVLRVLGGGQGSEHREVFRGGAYQVSLVPKVMLEWYGTDDQADAVVRAVQQRAATGAIGDGKIFLEHVDHAVRIRTGETDLDAV